LRGGRGVEDPLSVGVNAVSDGLSCWCGDGSRGDSGLLLPSLLLLLCLLLTFGLGSFINAAEREARSAPSPQIGFSESEPFLILLIL
jgi:hypothetical protein